jgi:hypothetical protein
MVAVAAAAFVPRSLNSSQPWPPTHTEVPDRPCMLPRRENNKLRNDSLQELMLMRVSRTCFIMLPS